MEDICNDIIEKIERIKSIQHCDSIDDGLDSYKLLAEHLKTTYSSNLGNLFEFVNHLIRW